MADALEYLQQAGPVLGFNINRIIDALNGLRPGIITITDPGGNTTISNGQVLPNALGGLGTAVPGTPTGLTASTGMDNWAQTNNAYILATWNANPTTDYVSQWYLDYYNVAKLAVGLTSGTNYTTLSLSSGGIVSALPYNVESGATVILTDEVGHTQTLIVNGSQTQGAVSLVVNSFTANFSYPAGAYILLSHGTAAVAGPTLDVKIHNLFPGLGYFLVLTASNNLGNKSPSTSLFVSIPPDTTPPDVPSGLTVYGAPHGVFLQWTPVSATNANNADLAGYLLEYSPDNTTWTAINTGPTMNTSMQWTNPATPSTASASGSFYFRIASMDYSGNQSAWSASVNQLTSGLSFAELLVGNLTTLGTLTSTGGLTTRSGGTGAGVDINGNGISLYNSSNAVVMSMASATGDLVINGNAAVSGQVATAQLNAVTIMSPNANVYTTGGVVLDGDGIQVISDGSGVYPAGYQSWFANVNGNFLAAQYFPTFSGYMPADGATPATMRFQIVGDIVKIISCKISFFLDSYKFGVQTTSASGSAHNHSVTTPGHQHLLGATTTNPFSTSLNSYTFSNGNVNAQIEVDSYQDLYTYGSDGSTNFTSANESSHYHNLNNPSQLVNTVYNNQTVYLQLLNPSGGVAAQTSFTGMNVGGAQMDFDVTANIRNASWAPNATGFWEVVVQPSALCAVQIQVNVKATVQAI